MLNEIQTAIGGNQTIISDGKNISNETYYRKPEITMELVFFCRLRVTMNKDVRMADFRLAAWL